MRLCFLFLLFLAGCQGTSLTSIRSHECEAIRPVEGISLAFCGRYSSEQRDEWLDGVPQVLSAFDEAAMSLGMPPISPRLDGSLIRIYDYVPGDRYRGMYRGYFEPETKSIELFIDLGQSPETTALAHEWFHLYDHHLNHLSYDEWIQMANDVPYNRHFSAPAIAQYVIEYSKHLAPEMPPAGLKMAEVACPGPSQAESTDGGDQ